MTVILIRFQTNGYRTRGKLQGPTHRVSGLRSKLNDAAAYC